MKKIIYLVMAVLAATMAMSDCSAQKESDSVSSENSDQNIKISPEDAEHDILNNTEFRSATEGSVEDSEEIKGDKKRILTPVYCELCKKVTLITITG